MSPEMHQRRLWVMQFKIGIGLLNHVLILASSDAPVHVHLFDQM